MTTGISRVFTGLSGYFPDDRVQFADSVGGAVCGVNQGQRLPRISASSTLAKPATTWPALAAIASASIALLTINCLGILSQSGRCG